MPKKKRPDSKHAAENKIIEKIAARAHVQAAKEGAPLNKTEIYGDIAAVHRNTCPLRLADLLLADDVNFMHDIRGIRKHLDTDTLELTDHFWPRYAQPGV